MKTAGLSYEGCFTALHSQSSYSPSKNSRKRHCGYVHSLWWYVSKKHNHFERRGKGCDIMMVFIIGWIGAKLQHLKRYEEWYYNYRENNEVIKFVRG